MTAFSHDNSGSERLSNLPRVTQQVGSPVCTRTQVCPCSPEPEAASLGLEPAGFFPAPRPHLGLIPAAWLGWVEFGKQLLIRAGKLF